MPTGILCSECSAELDFCAPGGFCTRCLFTLGLSQISLPADSSAERFETPVYRRLGEYELEEEIARGGMGVVFKARQVSMKRWVALKTVAAGHLASPDLVRRFKTEAEAAGRLNHPNIVPIYEIGEEAGCHFFSMRLIPGASLEQVLDRGRRGVSVCQFTTTQAVILLGKVARAVQYAHEHGVLHRDLKPANILLDPDGEPFVTDFGLARIVEQDSNLTLSQMIIGTAAYMPPEQAAGRMKHLTTAGDVYALGAVFYELLTGQPPFLGRTPLETMRQVVALEPQAPRKLNREVDLDLETICLKCLEKETARRYRSAAALADDLECWLKHKPISARPSNRLTRTAKWIRRQPVLSGLVGAIVSAVLIGSIANYWQYRRGEKLVVDEFRARQEANLSQAQLHLARANEMLATGNTADGLAVLAAAARRAPTHQAVVERLLSALPVPRGPVPATDPFVHSSGVLAADFSPTGDLVVTACADGTLRLWHTRRGRLLHTQSRPRSVTLVKFSPDGTRVLAAEADGTVFLINVARFLLDHETYVHAGPIQAIAFSADGRTFVSASKEGRATVRNSETGRIHFSIHHDPGIEFAAFSQNGETLVTTGADGSVRLWETSSGREITTPGFRHPDKVTFADLSSDGRWLVTASDDGSARIWDRQTRTDEPTRMHHHRSVRTARFSPDGRLVVTASDDGLAGLWEVPTGRPHCEMLRHEGPVHSAEFSRDGRHVVTASADGTARVWWAATGQLVNEVIRHAGPVTRATFSPDGKQVLTASLDGVACVWETTITDVPAPPWLADLAEGMGGRRWNGRDRFDPVPVGRLAMAKEDLNRAESGDRVTTWARWAADRARGRTVSPFGELSVTDFVQRRVSETNLTSLRLATQAAPQDALVLARLAVQYARAGRVTEAREAGRQAIEAAPESRETWLAWAEVSRESAGLDPKPHEMLGALERFPDDPRLWNLRAHLLERANRFSEAVAAYDRVLALLHAHPEGAELDESAVVSARSRLLPRVDQWMSEAVRERRARLGIPDRDAEAAVGLIDLSAHYTASLTEGLRGSITKGSESISELPVGITRIDGIPFDIRGLVALRGDSVVQRLPPDEAGIRVRQLCRRLRFLHGTVGVVPRGTTVSSLRIQCLSGETFEVPLRYGVDVVDLECDSTDLAHLAYPKEIIVEGGSVSATEQGRHPRLCLTTWVNPNPDDPVETIDFRSSASGSAPFLVAVTAE